MSYAGHGPIDPPLGQRRRPARTSRSSSPRWASRSPLRRRPARSTVDPGIAAYIESLDPAALTDADFDGLLAASGLVGAGDGGGLALPKRLAEVNAMLDLASPAMREALLVAFLDRLTRPPR